LGVKTFSGDSKKSFQIFTLAALPKSFSKMFIGLRKLSNFYGWPISKNYLVFEIISTPP